MGRRIFKYKHKCEAEKAMIQYTSHIKIVGVISQYLP